MVETAEGWGIIQKAACWHLVVFGETPGQERLSCDVFVAVPKHLAQPRCALRADGQHQIEGSCRTFVLDIGGGWHGALLDVSRLGHGKGPILPRACKERVPSRAKTAPNRCWAAERRQSDRACAVDVRRKVRLSQRRSKRPLS